MISRRRFFLLCASTWASLLSAACGVRPAPRGTATPTAGRDVPAAPVAQAPTPTARPEGPRVTPRATEEPVKRGPVFLTEARLDALRQRVADRVQPTYAAYQVVRRVAARQVGRVPHAPEMWYVPGYYRDAEGHSTAKRGLQDDANAAYALALHYRMSGEERYAEAAARLIDGWAGGVKQMRTQDDSMLSFSYHFPALILAADLIQGFHGWPAARQEAFGQFLRAEALPMNTMARKNNWGNWGLVLVMACAAWLCDDELLQRGVTRWKEFVDRQIAEDGHLPHEVHRNNGRGERGIWYTHFSLMPQTLAAEIARANGVDLYDYVSPNGRTLRQAFERVAPWARAPETFPYFQGDDPQEQKGTDYVSYFEILNARWPNDDATAMLGEMRPLTVNHCAPHLTFTHGNLL